MLSIPGTIRIYLHTQPIDLRKGADALSGVVRKQFQGDPQDGSLFLFFNRRPGAAAQRRLSTAPRHAAPAPTGSTAPVAPHPRPKPNRGLMGAY